MQHQLDQCLHLLTSFFGNNLVAIYLYGSSLVGGIQKYSDLALFVVTKVKLSLEEKQQLTTHLLKISGIYMKSSKLPLELTIVDINTLLPWKYPPICNFQYGEWLRSAFENQQQEAFQESMMPDLAVILTQLRLKSKTLYGPQPHDLLPIIPYRDFICAMLHDVERLSLDLMNDTRNVLLTLARIWVTLETLSICSKAQAASWVMNHLPQTLQPVMLRAKSIYLGLEKEDWSDLQHLIRPCADYIIHNIAAIASSVELRSSESITIADGI